MKAADNPIEQIVARFGTAADLARQIGRGTSTVSDWVVKGTIPSQRIIDVILAGRAMDRPIILEPNDFFPASISQAEAEADTMNRTQHFLAALGIITAVELSGWLAVKSGLLVLHDAHRPAGLPWLAVLPLVGALATVVVWLVIPLGMVRP